MPRPVDGEAIPRRTCLHCPPEPMTVLYATDVPSACAYTVSAVARVPAGHTHASTAALHMACAHPGCAAPQRPGASPRQLAGCPSPPGTLNKRLSHKNQQPRRSYSVAADAPVTQGLQVPRGTARACWLRRPPHAATASSHATLRLLGAAQPWLRNSRLVQARQQASCMPGRPMTETKTGILAAGNSGTGAGAHTESPWGTPERRSTAPAGGARPMPSSGGPTQRHRGASRARLAFAFGSRLLRSLARNRPLSLAHRHKLLRGGGVNADGRVEVRLGGAGL